ncbi:zinc finger CCCH domain-containing protein 66-like [Apium graveolens]|uniref:zinc finger CCCH domain-containing protein 66-like n=1 Tax=Apium graveolens TaxID=4045 RepID=UPI003D79D74E
MRVGKFQGQERGGGESLILLELAADDDLIGFRKMVEEENLDVDGFGLWYGRRVGLKKIGLEERTPLMVASMFGSKRVVMYILETGNVDINKACGSDAATALHCAVVGGSANVVEVVKLLLDASADVNCIDAEQNMPSDLIIPLVSPLFDSNRKMLELMLNGCAGFDEACSFSDKMDRKVSSPFASSNGTQRKDNPVDLVLPDIKNGIYGSDEFRMYTFKIKPCSRPYSHDWTECPFAHPNENAKRRDPRTFHYSCVPCPDFRKGTCLQGDACEYAHGIFECWLHPSQYRTRWCKDEIGCSRKVCFFAHKREELRPSYFSTGSGVHLPRSFSAATSSDFSKMSSLTLASPSVMIPPSSSLMTSSRQSSPMGSMWSNQCNFVHPNPGLSGSRLRTTSSARAVDLKAGLRDKEIHRCHQQHLLDKLHGLSSLTACKNPFLNSAAFAASQGYNNRKPNGFKGLNPTNLDDLQGQSLEARTTRLQSSTGMAMDRSMNQQLSSSYPSSSSLSSSAARTSHAFGNDPALDATSISLATARSSAFAQGSRSFIDRNTMTHHSASFGLRRSSSSFGNPAALTPSCSSK